MSKNKDKEVTKYKYKVYRKELHRLVPLLNTNTEDLENFKLIAANGNYIIMCDNNDITDKYRKEK